MKDRLGGSDDIYDAIIPTFAPGCRRLTPGPGFLEALTKDNVGFLTSPINSIDEKGVNLEDGAHVDLDCLICATGFPPSAAPQLG
jgi:cation diffusion facilitator CzcD-associated flavoprotein CzcO